MVKQISLSRASARHIFNISTLSVLFVIAISLMLSGFAQATPPNTMNFQGRLLDSTGAIRPDGLYNMQFRIYDAPTGGTMRWSEVRQGASRVQITNGLFSVQLGEVTPLPASLFDTTNLYFEITMPTPATATSATPSWESPMTPRNKLAASAYAFKAAKAADSDMLGGQSASAFAAATGSANYIQNTTTSQAASFNVSGSGAVGGTMTVGGATTINNTATVRTASATALQVQNAGGITVLGVDTSAGTVTIGSGGSTANGITMSANGMIFSGTARPDKTVSLSPEYAGATFTGDGSNNNGSLSSDFCSGSSRQNINAANCGATQTHNYYQWTTDQASVQDYDIFVRYQIPSDYDTGSMTNLRIWGWGTTSANEIVTVSMISDGAATPCSTSSNAVASNATWNQVTVATPLGACTPAAGDWVTFKVRVAAGQDNFARAGTISFDYKRIR